MSSRTQAIDCAMRDIGLTQDEAERAWEEMSPHFNNRIINPCQDCGVEIDNLDNNICDKCWARFQKRVAKLNN